MTMPRLKILDVAPEAYRALSGVESYIQQCGLEKSLIELVKMRASQINGCAYCLDMHSKDALKQGATPQRLVLLNAWRESSLYTPRERAALAWTETLTKVAAEGAPDAVYAGLTAYFTGAEIANLTTLIGMINLWNRIAIGFNMQHPTA